MGREGEDEGVRSIVEGSQPIRPAVQPVAQPAVQPPQPVQPVVQPAPVAQPVVQPAPGQPVVEPQLPPPTVSTLPPQPDQSFAGDPNITEFTAEENLRNKQISPGGEGQSRSELAQKTFDLIAEQGQTRFDADIRKVGQSAAKFGRIGSGLTTSRLGDVAERRNEFLGRAQRDLALRTASDEFGDRRSNRNELRTERGFQDTLAQRSIENARNQRFDEDALLSSEFGRKLDINEFSLRAGSGPSGAADLLASDSLLPQGVDTGALFRDAAERRTTERRATENRDLNAAQNAARALSRPKRRNMQLANRPSRARTVGPVNLRKRGL